MPQDAFAHLEPVLKALANANRLALLDALQTPKGYAELELPPSRADSWGGEDRTISRQAIRRHIEELAALGVVRDAGAEAGGQRFVVNRPALFAVVEQLRQLATVRPVVTVAGETMPLAAGGRPAAAQGPHLVLARGVDEGRVFPLADATEWIVGRAKEASVSLDYDPYVSSEHARIVLREGRFYVADAAANKNGTLLNWAPMVRGGIAPLAPGDVIGVGMSLLVFRA